MGGHVSRLLVQGTPLPAPLLGGLSWGVSPGRLCISKTLGLLIIPLPKELTLCAVWLCLALLSLSLSALLPRLCKFLLLPKMNLPNHVNSQSPSVPPPT